MKRILGLLAFVCWLPAARGDVIVTGFAESSLLRFNEANGTPGAPIIAPGSGQMNGYVAPAGVTFGPDGFLYVSCQVSVFSPGSPDFVMRVNPATGSFAPFIVLPSGYVPAGLRFGPDGNLWVSHNGGQSAGLGSGSVDRYNGITGALIDSPVTNLTQPTGLTFRGNELFVGNFGEGNVVRYNGTTAAPFTMGGGLAAPTGVTFGPDGNLYVTDVLQGEVLRYDGLTGSFQTLFIPAGGPLLNQFPSDLLFDRLGTLLVADLGSDFMSPSGNVKRFDATTGAFIGDFATGIVGASSLTLTPVPEPASLVLVGTVTALGFVIRRRRRR